MSVRVQIPTPMRDFTGGQATVEVAGATVQAALDDLARLHPGIVDRLYRDGKIKQFVNIYVNDEDIRYLDNLTTAVKDGDDVAIIPAVSGG